MVYRRLLLLALAPFAPMATAMAFGAAQTEAAEGGAVAVTPPGTLPTVEEKITLRVGAIPHHRRQRSGARHLPVRPEVLRERRDDRLHQGMTEARARLNSSTRSRPRASAQARANSSVGLLSNRSARATACCVQPSRVARLRCVNPAVSRASRSRYPGGLTSHDGIIFHSRSTFHST